MSRIDKALNRARQPRDDVNPTSAQPDVVGLRPSDAVSVPSPDAFSAPWTFDADAPHVGNNGPGPSTPVEAADAGGSSSCVSGPEGSERERVEGGPGNVAGGHQSSDVALAVVSTDPLVGFQRDVRERLIIGDHQQNRNVMAVAVEQYRRLAGTLHHAQADRGIKSVIITSAVASEGKTLTATNLALTLAESYRRNVLLIDADLRRPSLHEVFQLPNVAGLREALQEDGREKLTLLQVTQHLAVVPAGQPDADPMGLLTSERMQRILKEARDRYDWVIIDAPPVGLLTDANLLATMVDATLLVVEAAKTDYPIARRAIEAVGRDKILGVVLNKVDLPHGSYGYKYDKYYAAYHAPRKAR